MSCILVSRKCRSALTFSNCSYWFRNIWISIDLSTLVNCSSVYLIAMAVTPFLKESYSTRFTQFLLPGGCFPFVIMTVDIFSEKSYSLIFEYLMLWINAVKRNERFFSGKTVGNFFSIMHKCYINLLGLPFGRIGCFGMISSPCINIAYCSDDICRAFSAECDQLNAPLSNLL